MPPGQLQVQYMPAQPGGMQPVNIIIPGTGQVPVQQQAYMYAAAPQFQPGIAPPGMILSSNFGTRLFTNETVFFLELPKVGWSGIYIAVMFQGQALD